MENCVKFLQKSKNKTVVWFSHIIPGYLFKEKENVWKVYMHPNVHINLIYDS